MRGSLIRLRRAHDSQVCAHPDFVVCYEDIVCCSGPMVARQRTWAWRTFPVLGVLSPILPRLVGPHGSIMQLVIGRWRFHDVDEKEGR